MIRLLCLLACAALAFGAEALAAPQAVLGHDPAAAGQVRFAELYTSEACASCLPAEAAFAGLAARSHVVALSFHVGYWDYLGWTDRFAIQAATRRQWAYARRLHGGEVFTPELIMDGTVDGTGSDPGRIARMMRMAKPIPELRLSRGRNFVHVAVPALSGAAGAVLWVAAFDRQRIVKVGQGENAGHVMREVNIVRVADPVSRLGGTPAVIAVPAAPFGAHRGIAAFVQQPGSGPVLAAGMLPGPKSGGAAKP
ncbi:MAG TPA: DUF1223 domain-containing protein [Acetobacteraceae bacterium]|nr:DUF1223 domain-containing protein [Acetobacteraceae bacterium]